MYSLQLHESNILKMSNVTNNINVNIADFPEMWNAYRAVMQYYVKALNWIPTSRTTSIAANY